MKLFTREEIRSLASHQERPQVTVMMPVHPAGDQWTQDPIRFGNLLGEVEVGLRARGVNMLRVHGMLAPFRSLLEHPMPWKASGAGLALFLSPEGGDLYRVPLALPELVRIGDEYHLKPLIPLVQGDGSFYVLAIHAKEVRLLRCTRHFAQDVPLPGAPRDLDEALRFTEDPLGRRPFHSSRVPQSPGGPPTAWPQGFGHEDRKSLDFLEYFRQVDAAVGRLLAGEQAPLVYAGLEERLPLFRHVASYPHVLEVGVYGNPEALSNDDLRVQAWPLVEPAFREVRERDAARYHDLGIAGRASQKLDDVVHAALFGRVEVLFFDLEQTRPGHVDHETGAVTLGDGALDGADLVNEAVVHTLLTGGQVYGLPHGELPDRGRDTAVNAIYRW